MADRDPAVPGVRIRGRLRRAMTPQPPRAGDRPAPDAWRPDRFLVIAAHPDDAEFGPAATAAAWIDAGSVGRLVCCTSGDQGGEDPAADPLALAATREEEQRRAARPSWGTTRSFFLHQPDGALANELPLRELLVREIRRFRSRRRPDPRPEVLFFAGAGVNHADHRAAGMARSTRSSRRRATLWPFRASRAPAFPAHAVRRILPLLAQTRRRHGWTSARPGSARFDALRCHASQVADPDGLGERIRAWLAEEGEPVGVAAAEAFRVIVLDDDPDEGPHEAHGA